MGKLSTPRGVDVTYVKRGQVAVITRQPAQPSQKAQAAIKRAAARRNAR